ncbi:uncharacterized protein PFL1_04747 [Pseudozyma flocculosa PF-1]|uniref:PX domain-containing protein n=1 Tax=Pseudozyma flocculosa PF-1 TaxID=1277687 RepID=A0A061H591_9BASI|nr:uncharacterized protein PFL1_04747 [Pseudozyma flocculosa PF-1]EPQ27609.1 hypothetical protein PFL1_04747 [Pseudozyma flocculosa PF-1]
MPTTATTTGERSRPMPARLASEDGSHLTETEDEAFFSGEDAGALTHPESHGDGRPSLDEQSDSEDDRDDDEDRDAGSAGTAEPTARPAPALAAASTRPAGASRQDGMASTNTLTRSRSRAYSAPRKLAPEEEEWAIKEENRRRKGGVFGRLKRLGRGRKNRDDDDRPAQAYDAEAILGRSHSAVTELSGSARGSALDADDTISESGTAVRPVRQQAVERPSPIASEDELGQSDEESGPLTPDEVSDQPPRIATPIALREAENARSPELINPYVVSGSSPTARRAKSLAESVQPSVLDADGASTIPPPSPLLPASGPLSHQDAVVPSGRPSMQSARDQEIDQENAKRPRTASSSSNLALKSAAGGALGGLAAMIGFDALREDKNGVIKDSASPSHPVISRDLAATSDPLAELEQSESPMRVKSGEDLVSSTNNIAPTGSGSLTGAADRDASELPYIVDSAEVDRDVEGEAGAKKKKKSKKSKKAAAALAGVGAAGVGIGGLAAAVGSRTPNEEAALADTAAIPQDAATPKKKKSKSRALGEAPVGATPLGGANDDAVVLSNIPASGVADPVVEAVPADSVDGRAQRKKSKRSKEAAAAAAGTAVPAAVAAPAIASLVRGHDATELSSDEESSQGTLAQPPPFEATADNEKAGYASLGMTDAAAPAAGVVPAVAAAKPSRKASKRAKGSRPVEKLPIVVDEDEQSSTRLAAVPARKRNFLLTPSIAPSVADPLDSGMRARSIRSYMNKGDWLVKSLSPQQTHYFLRELARRELHWELDRAWLLTSFEKPTRERMRMRRQLTDYEDDSRINDFDDSSDEDLLAMETDEDEEAVFRKQPEQLALSTPDLPLLRFLFKNAFATFPLFVAPEDKLRSYGSTPPDKATIARSYFVTGVLPLLRAIQSRSLSQPVDRHGEGDGTPFSACSTTGAIRRLLIKWASKYVTAVLRVGPGDPYFGDEEPLSKDSWPWPASNLLPPEAYYAYRKPLDRLRYGGYEVDVVGVRRHSPTERDYILRIRRPNRLDEYVVRNDADFAEFQRNLDKELGDHSFVRPLPKTGGRPNEDSDYEDDSPYSSLRSSKLNHAGVGTVQPDRARASRSNSLIRRKPSKAGRALAAEDGQRSRGRRYSSGVQNGRPVLGRRGGGADDYDDDVFDSEDEGLARQGSRRRPLPRDFRAGRAGRDSVYGDEDVADDRSDAPPPNRRYERRGGGREAALTDDDYDDDDITESGRGGGTPRASKSKKSRLPFGLGSLSNRGGAPAAPAGDTLDSRRRGISRNLPGANDSRGSVAFRDGPPTYDAAPPRKSTAGPTPMDFEARRNKLRSWLRDTLAIREAGHALETQDFTSIAAFPEKALRRADLLDMDDRIREDKHRRREHERDAAEAGDDVHDLRAVRNDLWAECVEGDGLLKVYDTMVETPEYARLPLAYQQMTSWGNLQVARFLYGTFVAGDESRANLARLQDVYESIPWKRLSLAMKSPVSQMIRSWQDNLLRKGFLQAMLHVMLEDEPETIDEDLAELRRSIGSDVMFRKLRMFVESPDDLKRLIRQHAERAEIPLVAAIVRGSEQPKLNKAEVQRVMDATEAYQGFMRTQPSVVKKNAHKEPGYLLIRDLQRALRLFSLQRDGAQVRGMLQDPAIADALGAVFEPLLEELRRMHRVKGMGGSIIALERFLGRLIDHLSGLRARVQDPARSVHSLAEMLDGAAPSWYAFLHRWNEASPTVFSFFAWFRHLAMTVGAGSTDLAEIWTDPPCAPVSSGGGDGGVGYGRRKRNRQMEVASRWVAGETEEHHSVQVQGDGTGKTRSEPYLPKEPRPARPAPGLDRFRKSFREAVSQALAR